MNYIRAKVNVGALRSHLVAPEIIEHKGITFGQANQKLAGGNFKMLWVWDNINQNWKYLDSHKTLRKFNAKELDAIIADNKLVKAIELRLQK